MTTATETVQRLLTLQELDEEIEGRELELETLEPEVEEAEARLEEVRSELEAARNAMDEAEAAHRSDQRSVQGGRETMRRLRERADSVQDMRQHQAVRSEMATARRNLEQAEEEALRSLQQVESAKKRVAELEEREAEVETTYRERSGAVAERREALESELTELRERRSKQAEELENEVLDLYERVRGGRTDEVLAPLDSGHCGHCYTMVPPQRQNEIRNGGKLYRCEECGVILHAPGAAG